jgi:hypothetical protein
MLLALAAAVAACTDGTAPNASDGLPLLFSVEAPAGVSAAETTALESAFDAVDTYRITVRDSLTGVVVLADTLPVPSASDEHRFDFTLAPTAVGLRVRITVVGLDGSTELYRATAYTTVRAVTGAPAPVVVPVRYTGPGLRGTVTDPSGTGLAGVSVGLHQATSLVTSVATEPDGTYLLLNVTAGAYRVEPAPPPSLNVCPTDRSIDIQSGDALVADFVVQAPACQIDLLVLSGGDVDDSDAVATMVASTPGVTTSTFFYVNQTPGLSVLRQYDVVLLFTNGIFDETLAIGDQLADYVDAGGNLVIGSFYWQGRSDSKLTTPGWGRLETMDPFLADTVGFTQQGGATYAANDLDAFSIVAHPLTLGVSTLVSFSGYGAGVTAKPTATVVASWTDEAPLVGYRILGAGQRVVAVSLFPAADDPTDVTGDVQVLWENAVTWAGVAGGPTP